MSTTIMLLEAPNSIQTRRYGESIAIDGAGQYIAIGDPSSGCVYGYQRIDRRWELVDIFTPNKPDIMSFGFCISISSDSQVLVVGGYDHQNKGLITTYRREADGWINANSISQEHRLSNRSLCLNQTGEVMTVGLIVQDELAKLKIFRLIQSQWVEETQLEIRSIKYQMVLSKEGNTIAIGFTNTTEISIFNYEQGRWRLNANLDIRLRVGDSHSLSLGLDFAGQTLVVGISSIGSYGRVYVYTLAEGKWSTPVILNAHRPEQGELFGYDVAIAGDGSKIAVSAIAHNRAEGISVGRVITYRRSCQQAWCLDDILVPSLYYFYKDLGAALVIDDQGSTIGASAQQVDTCYREIKGIVFVFIMP